MEISVINYRGIKRADIVADNIALIQGPNQSGKSSITGAIIAALLNQPTPDVVIPDDKLAAKNMEGLVYNGEAGGSCIIRDGERENRLVWPTRHFTTSGQPPLWTSPWAAGRASVSLISMEPKERAQALIEIVGARPTKEDLAAFLSSSPPKLIDAVWEKIQEVGYESAVAAAKEKRRDAKAIWESQTGENWGGQKADVWRPKGWHVDLETTSEADLEAKIARAKEDISQSADRASFIDGRISSLSRLATSLPDIKQRLEKLTDDITTTGKEQIEINTRLESLKETSYVAIDRCPHCNKELFIVYGDLKRHGENQLKLVTRNQMAAGSGEAERISIERSRLVTLEMAASEKLQQLKNQHSLLSRDLKVAEEAHSEIETLKKEQSTLGLGAANNDAAKQKVAELEMTLVSIRRWKKASSINNHIKIQDRVIEALEPHGVRATVMMKKMVKYNALLAEISKEMKLAGPVIVDSEKMEIRQGDVPLWMLSRSAQFRVRIVLQIASVMIEKAPLMVLDSEIDMDQVWYARLLRVLLNRGINAVIAIRCDTKDKAINPANSQSEAVRTKCRAYWIEGATASQIGTSA